MKTEKEILQEIQQTRKQFFYNPTMVKYMMHVSEVNAIKDKAENDIPDLMDLCFHLGFSKGRSYERDHRRET